MEWIDATKNFPESMMGKLYEWQRSKEQYLGCKIQILSISN